MESKSGSIIGFVGSLEDVTDKKLQEETLRNNAMLLEQTGALADIGGFCDLHVAELLAGALEETLRIVELHAAIEAEARVSLRRRQIADDPAQRIGGAAPLDLLSRLWEGVSNELAELP